MAAACWLKLGKEILKPSCLLRENIRITCPVLPVYHTRVEYSVWNNGDLFQQSESTSHLSFTRNTSFLTRLKADELWQGVTGVSNPGRKRGRGKKLRGRQVDLNRGQYLGDGKIRMIWPGLNAPLTKGQEKLTLKRLPADPEREQKLVDARLRKPGYKKFKIPLLQRGWTGRRFPGMSIGPPDRVDDYTFEGFDSHVLEFKMVANVTGNLGKKMRFSALVVTGNQNGLAGFATAKSPVGKAALRKAKNMAAQRLQYVDRYQNHTVFHNFYTKHQQTAIYVNKAAEGSGIVAHRAIKTLCQAVGIKDLSAKVEGSTGNIQNLTKAFFAGLRNQETHNELADRTKLNVVEFRNNMKNVPIVVAKPQDGTIDKNEKPSEDSLNFENLYYNGRVPYIKPKRDHFFKKLRPYKKKSFKLYTQRNQADARRERIVLGIQPSKKELIFRNLPLK